MIITNKSNVAVKRDENIENNIVKPEVEVIGEVEGIGFNNQNIKKGFGKHNNNQSKGGYNQNGIEII